MTGKCTSGNSAGGLLDYCYYEKLNLSEKQKLNLSPENVRGEVTYVQNLAIKPLPDGRFDMDFVAEQFKANKDLNQNLNKNVWHQSFNFPENEVPNNEQIREISQKFSKDFGFENNQMIVFKHSDTKHNHFHIVANRLDSIGKTTASISHNYSRIGQFCRKIEREMGFQLVPDMKINQKHNVQQLKEKMSQSQTAEWMRETINKHLPNEHSIKGLKLVLKQEGIKLVEGRGINFIQAHTGTTYKGSDLGREYSRQNIELRLGKEITPALKQELKISKELTIGDLSKENSRGMRMGR